MLFKIFDNTLVKTVLLFLMRFYFETTVVEEETSTLIVLPEELGYRNIFYQ